MDSKQGVQSSAEDSQGDSSDPDANADDDDEDDEDSTKQTRVYALARRPFVVVAGDQANSGGGTAQDGEIMQGDGTTQGEKPTHPLTTSNLETIQSNYNTAEETLSSCTAIWRPCCVSGQQYLGRFIHIHRKEPSRDAAELSSWGPSWYKFLWENPQVLHCIHKYTYTREDQKQKAVSNAQGAL